MQRFFFHVRDDSDFTRDDEGQEFPSLEAAHQDAIRAIARLSADLPPDFRRTDIAFEITDAAGDILLTVPFTTARDRVLKPAGQIVQGPWAPSKPLAMRHYHS
ncbi:MAG: DUF6894 family protein [Geminicoccaceae bacterium]